MTVMLDALYHGVSTLLILGTLLTAVAYACNALPGMKNRKKRS